MADSQPIDVQLPPVPDSIEWAKFAAVAELLGLPDHIRSLTIDVNSGVTATLIMRGPDGRLIMYGDDVLTITVTIPLH